MIKRTTVGFIGIGKMGLAMAGRLIEHGFDVVSYDIRQEALNRLQSMGGRVALSTAQVLSEAAVIIVMVQTMAQIEDALFGSDTAADHFRPDAIVWVACTVAPADVVSLAQRLQARSVRVIDGPVSGGVDGAKNGRLTVMAGGSRHDLTILAPVFRHCASHVFHLGPIGTGSSMKMINQLLVAAHVALTAEAMALGAAAGIDPFELIDVIKHSAGTSRVFESRAPRMASGDESISVTVNTLLKDLDIVSQAAQDSRIPIPMAAAAREVYLKSVALGFGDLSDTQVLRTYPRMRGE